MNAHVRALKQRAIRRQQPKSMTPPILHPSHCYSYYLPLLDIDDARKYSTIIEKFKTDGSLLKVDVKPNSEHSAKCVLEYVLKDPSRDNSCQEIILENSHEFLNYLYEKSADIILIIHIKTA